MKGKKIEKYHTSTGRPRPYPGPWRVGPGSKILYLGRYGSGSESKFNYKGTGLGYPEGLDPFTAVAAKSHTRREGEDQEKKKKGRELQRETAAAARVATREKEKQLQDSHNLKQQI
ncbi:hypothetical protein M9H77_25721 [Catharanthus roseus]|uniref:Uncharacterized protein n=1 Tax=Catharanthus roseus TaxID=4058 RepID=A0ACC0AAA6_CATRO|nr:hypothetical protein M9H77_25721 [Catharanthus roseus]